MHILRLPPGRHELDYTDLKHISPETSTGRPESGNELYDLKTILQCRVASKQGKGGILAPATLEDARFDEGGNALPRVFVPRAGDVAAASNDGADLPSQVYARSGSSKALDARFKTVCSNRDSFDL